MPLTRACPTWSILDWMLPKVSGIEVCRRLRGRAETRNVPIIMLTARGEETDRIRGLDTGADDYVVKPFSMVELTARVRAVLRRIRPGLADDRITVGDIIIDRVAHRVKRDGKEIHLGPTEFRLLDYLMQHPGRVFSREQLLDAVWGSDVYVEARTVDVHIGRLRKALNGRRRPTIRSAPCARPAIRWIWTPRPKTQQARLREKTRLAIRERRRETGSVGPLWVLSAGAGERPSRKRTQTNQL
jgi:two-component system phosphate regulon response regulator PhoB